MQKGKKKKNRFWRAALVLLLLLLVAFKDKVREWLNPCGCSGTSEENNSLNPPEPDFKAETLDVELYERENDLNAVEAPDDLLVRQYFSENDTLYLRQSV